MNKYEPHKTNASLSEVFKSVDTTKKPLGKRLLAYIDVYKRQTYICFIHMMSDLFTYKSSCDRTFNKNIAYFMLSHDFKILSTRVRR